MRLHVGVGLARSIDRLEVYWPSGTRHVLRNVAAYQVLDIREPMQYYRHSTMRARKRMAWAAEAAPAGWRTIGSMP